jgi:hypothetical protein
LHIADISIKNAMNNTEEVSSRLKSATARPTGGEVERSHPGALATIGNVLLRRGKRKRATCRRRG